MLGPLPEREAVAAEAVKEVYGSPRMQLASLPKGLLDQLIVGLPRGTDFQEVGCSACVFDVGSSDRVRLSSTSPCEGAGNGFRTCTVTCCPALPKRCLPCIAQVLQSLRDIRPMNGGPGYSEDMVMYVRGLNFELE